MQMLTQRMGSDILCICVYITINAMLNFDGDVDVNTNANVKYEQSIILLLMLNTYLSLAAIFEGFSHKHSSKCKANCTVGISCTVPPVLFITCNPCKLRYILVRNVLQTEQIILNQTCKFTRKFRQKNERCCYY